jgi:hypothetical protein
VVSWPREAVRKKISKIKLGELLVEHGIVTLDQMSAALKRQSTMGGRLGQNLIHLDLISEDTLIRFLADQLNIPCVNLNTTPISPATQRLIPLADGSGRVLAFEKLANSYRIQNAIRDKRTHLIKSQSSGGHEDFTSMEISLAKLFRTGRITLEEGRKYAEDPKAYDILTK